MTSIPISIKHGTTTYHMHLNTQETLSKVEQFNMIADHVHIPAERLKLIYKGKRYTQENWQDLSLMSNMILMSIGEQCEDESNVNTNDIECLMKQMKIDRNTAVRTLKQYPNVIDAILYLGNQ